MMDHMGPKGRRQPERRYGDPDFRPRRGFTAKTIGDLLNGPPGAAPPARSPAEAARDFLVSLKEDGTDRGHEDAEALERVIALLAGLEDW
jgi:hypothetical protein